MMWWLGLFLLLLAVGGVGLWWQAQGKRHAPDMGLAQPAPSLGSYNPSKVGNDATARPWEAFPASFDTSSCDVPFHPQLGMREPQFMEQVKRNFVGLQKAWDTANIPLLRAMMTEDMVSDIEDRLIERQQRGPSAETTEISVLDAQLLGVEETENQYIASVEFSGMVRDPNAAAQSPFREIWDMSKVKGEDGAVWRVAGVESVQ